MPTMGYGDGTEFTRRSGPRKGEFVKRYRGPDGKWHATSWPKKPSRSAINDRLSELSSSSPPSSESESVAAFLDRWLADGTGHLRERTVIGYRRLVDRHLRPGLGAVAVTGLTTPIIQRWINEGATQHALAVLRAALSEAVRWGLIPTNPARLARPAKRDHKVPVILSPEETSKLLEQVKDDPMRALFMLAAYTGMRQGEILGLRWSDVSLPAQTLKVSTSLWWMPTAKGRQPVLTEPKTERSRRQVALHPDVVTALIEHRKAQMQTRRQVDDGLVFARPDGKALEPSTVYRALQRHLAACGLPAVKFHSLRHATASMLLASGMDVTAVSELLGHSSAYVTLSIYSHTLEKRRSEVATRMGDLLRNADTG